MMDPSRKRSFNDQWKKAFDEASITPPASAWEGIEARLDQDEIKRTFEDQWGKTFSNAAITPPPSVWEEIEARLDEEENVKIVPLWWQSPKLWYVAASIATLLFVGGLWFKNGVTESGRTSEVAVTTKPSVQKESEKPGSSSDEINKADESTSSETGKVLSNESIASATSGAEKDAKPVKSENARNKNLAELRRLKQSNNATSDNTEFLTTTDKNVQVSKQLASKEDLTTDQMVILGSKNNSVASAAIAGTAQKDILMKSAISAEMLAALPYKDLDVYFQKRYVFYQDNEPKSDVPVKKQQEYWAGLGLMPASFNPDVNLKSSPASFASKSFASQKALTGKNDPGFSYAVQTQGGMRVSRHWSVETGITYLQGNSQYEGGGYLLDAATYGSSNVLENALADAFYGNKGLPLNSLANTIYIDVSKQVRNDYQYLQLPVQAGFTLNPDGKLSYSLLGGMMANFFLNNELESDNGNVIKTTASDDVYRSLNWAATTGLRFNYRLSSKWRATLTGSYQKAVTSGFRANQNLESHPSLYGVSWGMRYSF